MKPELHKLCEAYIENREEVKKAFKMLLDSIYPICANIFLSHRVKADAARITACREYVKDNAGVLNNFRGSMYAPVASLLACSDDPAEKMARSAENYKLLKEYFFPSDQMVLASMLLTDMATPETAREKAERGKRLYKMMKEKHRFLTGNEDSVYAVLLAFSDKSDEAVIDDIEACFEMLKGMADRDSLQTVSQILSMQEGDAAKKCARFKELFEAIRAAGMKYGKNYELSVLASLSVTDVPIEQLTADIADVSDFLKTQKGYSSLLGFDRRTRLMHAAMLVATYYSPAIENDVASLVAMLSILAIEMMVLMIIATSHVY